MIYADLRQSSVGVIKLNQHGPRLARAGDDDEKYRKQNVFNCRVHESTSPGSATLQAEKGFPV